MLHEPVFYPHAYQVANEMPGDSQDKYHRWEDAIRKYNFSRKMRTEEGTYGFNGIYEKNMKMVLELWNGAQWWTLMKMAMVLKIL